VVSNGRAGSSPAFSTKDRNIKLLRFFCAKKLSFCPKKPFLKPYCFPLVALPIFYERVVISIFNLISLIRRSVLFFVSQKQPCYQRLVIKKILVQTLLGNFRLIA